MNKKHNIETLLLLNPFELFELSQTYSIDLHELNDKKNDLQRSYHPDKCIDNTDMQLFNNISGFINSSYAELVNPINRAILLLKLNNINFDINNIVLSQDLLMSQMEIREKINNNKNSFDKIHDISHELEIEYYKIINALNQYFDNKNYEEVKILITKLSYYNKLLSVVNEYIRDLI